MEQSQPQHQAAATTPKRPHSRQYSASEAAPKRSKRLDGHLDSKSAPDKSSDSFNPLASSPPAASGSRQADRQANQQEPAADPMLNTLLPGAAQQLASPASLIDTEHHVQQVALAGRKLNSQDPRYQEVHLRTVLPTLLEEAYTVLDTYSRHPTHVDQALLLQALRFLQWLVEQHCIANDMPFAAPAPQPRARRRLAC
eukprot:m.23017 g.23017  ORF g.23017 m.23017 type:complete len:198 (+) comp11322_c0_seq1:396-989(+)